MLTGCTFISDRWDGEVEGGKTTIKMLFGVTSYEKHQLCATSHKLREPIAKGYLTSININLRYPRLPKILYKIV